MNLKIKNALIKMDNSFLLKRLRERLSDLSETKDSDVFNVSLAKKTLGLVKSETKLTKLLKR